MVNLRAHKRRPIKVDMARCLKLYIVENNRRGGKHAKTIDHSEFRFRSSKLRRIEKRSNACDCLIESGRIVRVCLVQSRNLSFESANPEPIDDAFEEAALHRQCSNACFSFLNRADRLRAMRVDHLWPSLLKLGE